MPSVQRTDHLTELLVQAIDADGTRCSECKDPGLDDKLLMYATKAGGRTRIHNGLFCSKACHDRFHGLAPRS
jgi:hypothetical protein